MGFSPLTVSTLQIKNKNFLHKEQLMERFMEVQRVSALHCREDHMMKIISTKKCSEGYPSKSIISLLTLPAVCRPSNNTVINVLECYLCDTGICGFLLNLKVTVCCRGI